jgi:hypothetical protein
MVPKSKLFSQRIAKHSEAASQAEHRYQRGFFELAVLLNDGDEGTEIDERDISVAIACLIQDIEPRTALIGALSAQQPNRPPMVAPPLL